MDPATLRQVSIVLYSIFGLAIVASFIEALVLWWLKRPYDFREAAASLVVTAGRLALNVVPLSIAFPAGWWLYEHRLWSPTLDSFAGFAVLFIGIEFFYYWFHRASHRVRWFWANHGVHHSPNSLNFSAAYRLGWTSRIGGSLIFFLPLMARLPAAGGRGGVRGEPALPVLDPRRVDPEARAAGGDPQHAL